MPAARYSAVTSIPASVLWRKLADIGSWPRWLRAPYADERVVITSPEGRAERIGSEFTLKGRLPYRLFARITDWQPERRLEFEIYRSEYPSDRLTFGHASIAISLELADDARTRVSCEHRPLGKGPGGRLYAATVMRPFLRANVRRIVDNLIAAAGR